MNRLPTALVVFIVFLLPSIHAVPVLFEVGENYEKYDLQDGTYEMRVFSAPHYFLNDSGEWEPINASLQNCILIEDCTWKGEKAGYKAKFKDTNPTINISRKGYSIQMEIKDFYFQNASTTKSLFPPKIKSKDVEASGNAVVWHISDGVDIQYNYTNVYLYKNIIFYNNQSYYDLQNGVIKYEETLTVNGLRLFVNESEVTGTDFNTSGEIELKNYSGQTIFIIVKPFVYNNASKKDLVYEVKYLGNDQYSFTLVFDNYQPFFSNYPVFIDPTMTVYASMDATVDEAYPNTNFGSTDYLLVGRHFSNLQNLFSYLYFTYNIPLGYTITSASLNLACAYNGDSQTSTVIYNVTSNWNEGTITWNNKPAFATALSGNYYATCNEYTPAWNSIPFSVNGINRTTANLGLRWGGTANSAYSYKHYKSRESVYDPYLSITYVTSTNLSVNVSPPSPAPYGYISNFTANYSNFTDGVPIIGATCNLKLNGTTYQMNYDSTSGLYYWNSTLAVGNYSWNVSCSKANYESKQSATYVYEVAITINYYRFQFGNASIDQYVNFTTLVEVNSLVNTICNYTLPSDRVGILNVTNNTGQQQDFLNTTSWVAWNCSSEGSNYTVFFQMPAPSQSNWTQNTTAISTVSNQIINSSICNPSSLNYSNVSFLCHPQFSCSYLQVNVSNNSCSQVKASGDVLTETFGSYSQDTTKNTTAGGFAHIKRGLDVTNNATINFTNIGTNWAGRSGWNCVSSGNIDVSTDNYSNSYYETCNQTNIITKTIPLNALLNTTLNTILYANVSWYYWVRNVTLNNTDPIVSYNNVYWEDTFSGQDIGFAGAVNNGTANLLASQVKNITSNFRTAGVSLSTDYPPGVSYRVFVNATSPLIDSAFLNANYHNISTNVTIDPSRTNLVLFWWNGTDWHDVSTDPAHAYTIIANKAIWRIPPMIGWSTQQYMLEAKYLNVSIVTNSTNYNVNEIVGITVRVRKDGYAGAGMKANVTLSKGMTLNQWTDLTTDDNGDIIINYPLLPNQTSGEYMINASAWDPNGIWQPNSDSTSFLVNSYYNFIIDPTSKSVRLQTNTTLSTFFVLVNGGNENLGAFSCASNLSWVNVTNCPSSLDVSEQYASYVFINATDVSAGNYTALLNFSSGSISKTAILAIEVTPAPTPNLDLYTVPAYLSFSVERGGNYTGNVTIVNSGNAEAFDINCSSTINWVTLNQSLIPSISNGSNYTITFTATPSVSFMRKTYPGQIYCIGSNTNRVNSTLEIKVIGAELSLLPNPYYVSLAAGASHTAFFVMQNIGETTARGVVCRPTGAQSSWIGQIAPTIIGDIMTTSIINVAFTILPPAQVLTGNYYAAISCNGTNVDPLENINIQIVAPGEGGGAGAGGAYAPEIQQALMTISPDALSEFVITDKTTQDVTFTLTNTGKLGISCSLEPTKAWVHLNPTEFSLAPSQSEKITASITADINDPMASILLDCVDSDGHPVLSKEIPISLNVQVAKEIIEMAKISLATVWLLAALLSLIISAIGTYAKNWYVVGTFGFLTLMFLYLWRIGFVI